MDKKNLLIKYYVEHYAKGKSVIIKDPCGYLLSLPNNKDQSGRDRLRVWHGFAAQSCR